MNETKASWQGRLLCTLPPEAEISERNAAINSVYASWHLRHPDWFRWAGMAAFASYRVGLLLAPYDFSFANGAIEKISDTYDEEAQEEVLTNLEILRQANNAAFANAGWAHLAYESANGGIEAVESGLSDDPSQQYLLGGFRLIEEGRRLVETDPSRRDEADAIFWRGNLLLLQHEQWGVIQQHFERLNAKLGLFLTLLTSLDFDANHFVKDRKTRCSFLPFIWTRGICTLVRTLSLPDITRLAHRWAWIRRQVFPTWRRVVRRDPHLRRKLAAIVRAARPFDPSGISGSSA